MDIKQVISITHTLSTPSKMPCHGYSIPAKYCKTGAKLRNVEGSICSDCYACKGRYVFPNVQNALELRFANINHPQWVEAITSYIQHVEKSGYFRWHDSGDIQSVEHLANIVQVAKNLPNIAFWLPTREYGFVSEYLKTQSFPSNLTVRLSAFMKEGTPPTLLAKRLGLTTSGSSKKTFNCMAPNQGGKCLSCRMCWDKNISHVVYKTH